MRMYRGGAVMVSWEKGSDFRRIEITGPLGSNDKTHYVSFEDTGDDLNVRMKWNVGQKAIGKDMDSEALRELARELLQMADIVDTRAGRPLPKNPLEEDELAKEFFTVFDPRPEKSDG